MSILHFILIALLLIGCTQDIPEVPQPPLKIGISIWFGYAHAFIAQKKGLFKKHGVKVNLILKPDVVDTNRLYRNGELDGLFNVLPDILILNAEGLATQIVYITDYSNSGDIIFGRPEFESLRDLKGKRIAFEGINTFSHLLVVKLLERAGVQEGEYQGVNLLASKVLEALETKKIDAGHIYGSTQALAIKKGYKILGKAGDIPGIITGILAFKTEVVKKRPKEIQGVIAALLEAREFMQTHQEEAWSIMTKALGISNQEMNLGLQGLELPNLQDNIMALQTGGVLFNAGRQSIDFYFKKGQLPQLVDLNKVLNGQFVQALSKE